VGASVSCQSLTTGDQWCPVMTTADHRCQGWDGPTGGADLEHADRALAAIVPTVPIDDQGCPRVPTTRRALLEEFAGGCGLNSRVGWRRSGQPRAMWFVTGPRRQALPGVGRRQGLMDVDVSFNGTLSARSCFRRRPGACSRSVTSHEHRRALSAA
jgi:hypothetical protein